MRPCASRARSLFRVRVIRPRPCCTGRNPFSWLTRARSSVASSGTPAPANLGRAWKSIVMAPPRQPTRQAVTRFEGSTKTTPIGSGSTPTSRPACSADEVTVPDTDDYAPVAADIAVTRFTQTAVITGRMIDAATGKGIRGDIHLAALAGNAFARMLPYSRLRSLHVNRGGRHLPDRDHPRPRAAHGRRGPRVVACGTGVSLAQVQAGDGRPQVSSVFPGRPSRSLRLSRRRIRHVCKEAFARSSRSNRARRSSRTLPWSPQVRSRSRSRTPPAARSSTPSSGKKAAAYGFGRSDTH